MGTHPTLKGELVCLFQTKNSPVGICMSDLRKTQHGVYVQVFWAGKSGHRSDVNSDIVLEDVRDLEVISHDMYVSRYPFDHLR